MGCFLREKDANLQSKKHISQYDLVKLIQMVRLKVLWVFQDVSQTCRDFVKGHFSAHFGIGFAFEVELMGLIFGPLREPEI